MLKKILSPLAYKVNPLYGILGYVEAYDIHIALMKTKFARPVDSMVLCGIEITFLLQIICIWGAGGATPGKFLLGLRVVTCDTSVLIAPSRVLVIPSSNVSMTT